MATTASDSQLVVTARTFSRDKTNGGTFGQFIPGVTAADAVGNGERALQIVQLEESPAFRTNLGLVEVTGNAATVELLAYTPDSKVAARTVVPLGAGQYLQQGQIFKSLGFSNVYNGRITATSSAAPAASPPTAPSSTTAPPTRHTSRRSSFLLGRAAPAARPHARPAKATDTDRRRESLLSFPAGWRSCDDPRSTCLVCERRSRLPQS